MPPTNRDADFWWLRYFGGLVMPLALGFYSICSLITLRSVAIWSTRHKISIVPVTGRQAVLMAICHAGLALALFAECFAQYHERMAYHYHWLLVPGMLMAGGGMLGCSFMFLFH